MSGNYEGESINPRYQVQQPAGPYMRVVWDTWLNVEAAKVYGAYAGAPTDEVEAHRVVSNRTQLMAETRASELNLQSQDPLRFVEVLADHITSAVNGGTPRGEVLEDVSRILEHYAGRLRGTKTASLNPAQLYVTAPWLDTL